MAVNAQLFRMLLVNVKINATAVLPKNESVSSKNVLKLFATL